MRSICIIFAIMLVMTLTITTSTALVLHGISIYDGKLPGSGHSWSGIFKETPCESEPFYLRFQLDSIQGGFHVNINMMKDRNNRYAIGFMNLGNGSMSVYLFEEFEDETKILIEEKLFPLNPTEIYYPIDYIQPTETKFSSTYTEIPLIDGEFPLTETDLQVSIEYDPGHIQVYVSRPGQEIFRPLIDYVDEEDPLPPGYIDFETLEGSSAHLSQVSTSCIQAFEESRYMGIAYFKEPDPTYLINATSDEEDFFRVSWGEVPANQILVMIDDSISFEEARSLARDLARGLSTATGKNASVVGEFEYINLFQIETQSRSLDELIRDISVARRFSPLIVDAFPNEQIYSDDDDLAENPYYSDSTIGGGYQIIGVQKAWNGIAYYKPKFSKVKVGIVDDGIYLEDRQFDNTDINTSLKIYPIPPDNRLFKQKEGIEKIAGSHGTGVANMLAADTNEEGLQGIACILRDDLCIFMINITGKGKPFVTSSLLAFQFEIQNGSSIITCSMGKTGEVSEGAAEMYDKFFSDLSEDDPFEDVLFIFSAGNQGEAIEGYERIPNGLPTSKKLKNVITVGNILNNREIAYGQDMGGWTASKSNKNPKNGEYIALAAPGEQAFWGWSKSLGSDGIMNIYGGTSMAAPQVTAAAILIRSIDPCLNASQIKERLISTARLDGPSELGMGRILAIDKAVNETINSASAKSCEPYSTTFEIVLPGELNNFDLLYPDIGVGGIDLEILSSVYTDSNRRILYCQEGNIIMVYNRIYLAGPGLDKVKKVTYYLHESLPEPVQISTNPNNDFEIWIMTWGSFLIKAEIETKDDKVIPMEYDFSFRDKVEEAKSIGVPMVLVPCDADLSYWTGGSFSGGEPPTPSGFDVTISIISQYYKGYTISVDGQQIGVEGQGGDPLDGSYSFTVAGNQQHMIRVEHPINWKWWQYFYNAGDSITYNF